jgi:hypothetical protein
MGCEGNAISDPSTNPLRTKPPTNRLRALEGEGLPEARRFSPLNAPQRAAVEAFCTEAAGWARRQAKRTYGHLPEDMRLQAIERAMRELRLGAPPALDRTTLYSALADELTEQLRRVHAGWCLNAAQAQWRQEGPVAVPSEDDAQAAATAVGAFVENGLVGLERAVLQLEIGAGRDTRTSRAALRLGPRAYDRHRTEGLSKLRSAINGHAGGRVCEDHRDAVVLAATGDAEALKSLSSGPDRCRTCAREAASLRRVLQQRLAVAPWPLVVKPAGLVAAKLATLGAVFGGNGAGAAGLGAAAGTGPFSTSGAMAILATAAIATGAATVVDDDPEPRPRATTPAAQAPAAIPAAASTAPRRQEAAGRSTPAKAEAKAPAKAKPRTTTGAAPAVTQAAPTKQSAPAAPVLGTTGTPQPAAPTQDTPSVREKVAETVTGVRETADPVTNTLPPPVQQPVEKTLDTVEGTLDEVTGTVDGLLP